MARAALVVVVLGLATVAQADRRPSDGVFRAAPGLGYAVDNADRCTMQGRQFVGGFAFEWEAWDGVFAGAATTIFFNTLLADRPCGVPDGVRLASGFVIGPSVEWYPYEERGLSLFALAGYASIEADDPMVAGTGHGVGGTLGVGWDWRGTSREDHSSRFGVRAQLTAAKTWTGWFEHRVVLPSLVFTCAFD